MLKHSKKFCTLLILAALCGAGCSSNQTVKNAWKGTKGMWYTYVSPSASIDYSDKGDMSAHEQALASRMMGIDVQLSSLERVMSNADKPPTTEWMGAFFNRFPWVNGFTGLKADGTIVGQEPSVPMKPLDFTPLLEEDKKQNMRALRGHVQDTPMGPEIFLAAPLYDGQDMLGIVAAHFDMRSLIKYSANPADLVILSPQAVLWAGNQDVATSPLGAAKWDELITKSSNGTISSGGATYYWVARYLGNQPLVFAVPVSAGDGKGEGAAAQASEAAQDKDGSAGQPGQSGQSGDGAVTRPSPVAPKASPVAAPRPTPRAKGPASTPPGESYDVDAGSKDSVLLPQNSARPSPFGPARAPEERKLD